MSVEDGDVELEMARYDLVSQARLSARESLPRETRIDPLINSFNCMDSALRVAGKCRYAVLSRSQALLSPRRKIEKEGESLVQICM